jgi:hypothetical protein
MAMIAMTTRGVGHMEIIDLSNPVQPRRVGALDTSGCVWSVAVAGATADVADWSGGLHILDVTDPAQPRRIGNYPTSGSAYGVTVAGGVAYVADGGRAFIDASNATQPRSLGRYVPADWVQDVAVVGATAGATAWDTGNGCASAARRESGLLGRLDDSHLERCAHGAGASPGHGCAGVLPSRDPLCLPSSALPEW